MKDYTAGEVRGMLASYMHLNPEHVGSLAHCKSLDLRRHYRRLPVLLKEVCFLYGVMGLPSRETSERLDISKDTVLKMYDIGTKWLRDDMNGEPGG